jgi:uncharacterized protein YbbC (DUF1343 family)
MQGEKLSEYLNSRQIPGVRFVPVKFTPKSSVFKDENCGGINIVITDRAVFRAVTTGIEIAVGLRQLYPAEWKVDSYLRLLVNADALERVKRGEAPRDIVRSWSSELEEFRKVRMSVMLYQ